MSSTIYVYKYAQMYRYIIYNKANTSRDKLLQEVECKKKKKDIYNNI